MKRITWWVSNCMVLFAVLGAVNAWAGSAAECTRLVQSKQYKEAFPECKYVARQGSPLAQLTLGAMYVSGLGTQKNFTKAARWYRKAAKQGNAKAQYILGMMYADGEGVMQDYVEAVNLWRKAAKQGHASAQYLLGIWYYNNRPGVQQDYAKAARWYRKAAKQGNAKAQYNLGVMYNKGQGVNQSYKEAVKWYRKAAEQGHVSAQFNLGVMYATGKGVMRSGAAAADWYYKAGLSYLKENNRDDALTSVERIKALSSLMHLTVPNDFLADKLMAQIYGGGSMGKTVPRKQQQKATGVVSGTGWPVAGGYIVTNHHVVAGHQNIVLVRRDGKLTKASVAVDDVTNDLVLLKPESMKYIPPALPLASRPAKVGGKVFTVGYPHPGLMGAEPKLTQGIVNARSGIRNDPRVYQISVPIQSGNSGGPLLNMRGEVVGVTTSKLSAAKVFKWTGDIPQNVNYAVKSGYIRILLSSVDPVASVAVLPVKKAELSDLAQRIEGSVLMIIAK